MGHETWNTMSENNKLEDGDVQVVETMNNDNFDDPKNVKEVEGQPSGIKNNFAIDEVIKTVSCDVIQVQTIASQPENLTMVVASQIHDRQVQIEASKHGEKDLALLDSNPTKDQTLIRADSDIIYK
ncbi:hypothetical protein HAX54_012190 [Datura stramonium]|uniref:Uncharacterized protein n=1 Tax=Datura stramonium TaxID=4076 RepID=A0ABS8TJE8_DATST|nr:hypothetical protein [Datura stramonium]